MHLRFHNLLISLLVTLIAMTSLTSAVAHPRVRRHHHRHTMRTFASLRISPTVPLRNGPLRRAMGGASWRPVHRHVPQQERPPGASELFHAKVLTIKHSVVKHPSLPHRVATDLLGVVVEGAHVTHPAPNSYELAFGTLQLLDQPTATWPITLRNKSARPVQIEELTPSCGCTSAVLRQSDEDVPLPFALAPGGSATLLATVDTTRLTPGEIRKGLVIHSDVGDLNVALTGTGVGPAQFSVDSLAFGKVMVGQSLSRRIAVRLDPRVASIPFRIVSDDPNVLVKAVEGTDCVRREYIVSLADPPRLGPVNSGLTLLPDDDSGGHARNYSACYLPVSATIVSDVDVQPTEATFGIVHAGTEATLDISLTGAKASISSIKLKSDTQFLSCMFSNEPGRGNRVYIKIVLSGKTPPGSFASQVRVTTPCGACFAIPVSAIVMKLDE